MIFQLSMSSIQSGLHGADPAKRTSAVILISAVSLDWQMILSSCFAQEAAVLVLDYLRCSCIAKIQS